MIGEERFNGKAILYEQFRSGYPLSFFKEIITKSVKKKDPIIADIGAGTGIFTNVLSNISKKLIAVEPNDEMRAILKKNYSNRCLCIKGQAENTGLSDDSVDVITVAQAFHWFDILAFRKECKRILKKNGLVMLIWNSREQESNINKESARISKKYCSTFQGFSGGIKIEKLELTSFFTSGYERYSFSNPLKLTKEQFIGRNLSASYAPSKEDKYYESFVEELSYLYEKNCTAENYIIVPNDVHVFIGAID